MTELPDDMEAARKIVAALRGRVAQPVGWTQAYLNLSAADMIEALLLDYQERGRALERIAATPLLNDGGAQRRLGQVVTKARAALNQKGKSHDQ